MEETTGTTYEDYIAVPDDIFNEQNQNQNEINNSTSDNDWSYFEKEPTETHTDFNDELFAGIFGTFFVTFILVIITISVISIVAMWKIFKKAGQEGWKSIIPIYNTYVLYEISGLEGWYAFLGLIPFVGSVISMVMGIICYIKLTNSFGKESAFAVGLILLPIIFLPILAFDSSEYIGPDGVKKSTI